MPEPDDIALLRQYAENGSETAFATLVERHVNLVYSVALRRVGHPQAAEEIVQAVFVILARKAKSLRTGTVLAGWLHQTARLTAANFLRGEIRRQKREQEAFVQSNLNESEADVWSQLAPLLDDAIARLGERDRDAILLRYFENKDLRTVGAGLGASEDAAKMRVNRAVEKLRNFFVKRGIALSAAVIAGAVSANSIQAAPLGLAQSVATLAAAKGATVSASTLTLIKGALKIMAWTKIKTASVGALVLTGLVFTPLIIHHEFKIHSGSSSTGAEHWSKDSLSDEGYRTPEAALETFLWAMTRADYDACMAGATPEDAHADAVPLSEAASGSTDGEGLA